MAAGEPGSGQPGPEGERDERVWDDVTERQPERQVPEPGEPHPVPAPGEAREAPAPGAEIGAQQPPPPPYDPTAPQGQGLTEAQAQAAWGQPHQPAPGHYPYAPVQPASYQPQAGGPVFVNPDSAAPYGPPGGYAPGPYPHAPQAAPSIYAPLNAPPPQPYAAQAPGQHGAGQPSAGGAPPQGQYPPQPYAAQGQYPPQPYAGGQYPLYAPYGQQPQPGGPVFMPNPADQSPIDREQPWRWWVGPLAVTIAIVGIVPLQILLALFLAAVTGAKGNDVISDYTHWFGILQDVAWVGVVIAVPLLIVKYLRPDQLGIRKAPVLRSAGIMLALYALFWFFSAMYAGILGLNETDNTMLQDTGFGDSLLKDVVYALLFVVAAPVAEELLFRSLLFRTLRDGLTRAWGPGWGLAAGAGISGIFFGAIHINGGQNSFLPLLMMFGIVLALAYHWSGTIYVPIVLHAINNAVATGFNSDPSNDLIYVLIFGGPVIAFGTTWLIGRGIARFVRSEPRNPAPLPAEEHVRL